MKNNIARYRRFAMMSQTDLAEQVGVSRVTIGKWEKGTTSPSTTQGLILADILEVTLTDLFVNIKE